MIDVFKQLFTDVWYCSEECAVQAENDDHLQNYTKVMMWRGLN